MPNITVRGLDEATLARIKARARRRRTSVNRLIVETLQREYSGARVYDDLDGLVGKWSQAEADAFAKAIAPFGEIDPELWPAESRVLQVTKTKGRK